MHIHACAPILLLCLTLFLVAAVLPKELRSRFSTQIARIEETSGLTTLIGSAMLLYYLVRLISDPLGLQALLAS